MCSEGNDRPEAPRPRTPAGGLKGQAGRDQAEEGAPLVPLKDSDCHPLGVGSRHRGYVPAPPRGAGLWQAGPPGGRGTRSRTCLQHPERETGARVLQDFPRTPVSEGAHLLMPVPSVPPQGHLLHAGNMAGLLSGRLLSAPRIFLPEDDSGIPEAVHARLRCGTPCSALPPAIQMPPCSRARGWG